MFGILTSAELWTITFPAVIAILVWLLNERSKLRWEQYKRRDESYRELLRRIPAFYVGGSRENKVRFLEELNVAWLYAPDDVIKKAYAFLDTVHTEAAASEAAKEEALGQLVSTIRRDLLSRKSVKRTYLRAEDYRRLAAT